MAQPGSISVIVPTYRREAVLVETLQHLLPLLGGNDEIVVVDQTLDHEAQTRDDLARLARRGQVRWFVRSTPGICQAMNCGAWLARGEILLFLDDDIIPSPRLLEAHRDALSGDRAPPATCGQVLQPWNEGPVDTVRNFREGFNFAYCRECDVLGLMGGNFGIRRQTFLDVGGIDENFFDVCYRWEAELSYRLLSRTGRKIRFLPEASLRHLQARAGGTRAYGTKDTWRHISGSVGDYYFAWKCLPAGLAFVHSARRLVKEPVNRHTIRRPWTIPALLVREIVACGWAVSLLPGRHRHYIRAADGYAVQVGAA